MPPHQGLFRGHKELLPTQGVHFEGIGLVAFDATEHGLEDMLGAPDDGIWESMGVFLYERYELTVHLGRGPALINWPQAQTDTTLFGIDPFAADQHALLTLLSSKEGAPPRQTTSNGARVYRFPALSMDIKAGRDRVITLFPEGTLQP